MFETILSGIIDEYPHLFRDKKTIITAVACFVEFVLGLPCITEGGIYVLQIMDWYCASFSLMLISMIECLALSWCYGVDRLYKDIAMMIGYEPHFWWRYMWKFVTPLIIMSIWLFSVITLGPVSYGDYEYPSWSIIIGWMLGVVSIIPIPVVAIVQIVKTPGTLSARIRYLIKPDKSWGPAQPEDRKRYLAEIGMVDTELETVTTYGEKTAPPKGNGVYDETTVAFLPNKS